VKSGNKLPHSKIYAKIKMLRTPQLTTTDRQLFDSCRRAPVRGLSLRANFAWTFIGNVVYAGCQWGMLVVLAKLGTPETVGRFALGLAVTAPVLIFTNLQLRGVLATDATHEYRFSDYLGLRLITTIVGLLIIGGVVLVAGYQRQTAAVILVIGLAKGFESVSDVFYALLQQNERMDRIAISMMIKAPLSLAALALGFYVTNDLLWAVAALAATWGLLLAVYDIRNGALVLRGASQTPQNMRAQRTESPPPLRPCWTPRTLNSLTWLALPLGIAAMLISLNANIPRYFIEHHLGAQHLGIFAAMAYVMLACNTLMAALGQSASPRLSQYYAAGNRRAFGSLLIKLLSFGLILGGAGVLIAAVMGRAVLTLLYGPQYAEYAVVFRWLMIAAAISYVASFMNYGMVAARYFRVQTPLFLATSVITTLACALLIPNYQLLGAAYATVIAMSFQLAGAAVIVAHAVWGNTTADGSMVERKADTVPVSRDPSRTETRLAAQLPVENSPFNLRAGVSQLEDVYHV
jgi:O-antigen/teichoic acid export membrane protein